MKRVLWLATALAGGIAASTGVRAQPVTGVYVGLGGGGNFMQQPKVATTTNFGGIVDSDAVRLGFDAGYVGLGSIGYGFGNGLRVEIEGDYRYNRPELGAHGQRQGRVQRPRAEIRRDGERAVRHGYRA